MKKGLIHVYTGEGKGKTTCALGLSMRAAGWGMRVLFVQFFKEDSAPSGEKRFLERINDSGIEIMRSNCKHPMFTGEATNEEFVEKAITSTYEKAKNRADSVDLLVLDEVMAALRGGWLDTGDLVDFLLNRPSALEVVLTGREAPPELVRMADYVTEMLKIKHPFDEDVPARKGIEY